VYTVVNSTPRSIESSTTPRSTISTSTTPRNIVPTNTTLVGSFRVLSSSTSTLINLILSSVVNNGDLEENYLDFLKNEWVCLHEAYYATLKKKKTRRCVVLFTKILKTCKGAHHSGIPLQSWKRRYYTMIILQSKPSL
jgi:hypothetical protein